MPDINSIHQTMEKAVDKGVFPGAVLLAARGEEILVHQAYGLASLIPVRRPMTRDTVFDLASLTKPLATTPAIMSLVAAGSLTLDRTLKQLGEPFLFPGKEGVSIRQLLAHTAGFSAYHPYYLKLESITGDRKAALRELVQREPLENKPGKVVVYSDLGFIYLEWIFEVLSGQGLHDWTWNNLYHRLGLKTMRFRPLTPEAFDTSDCYAATEDCPWRKKVLCGEVHDENTWAVGGVSGQAGLFGTTLEVFRLLRGMKTAWDQGAEYGVFDGETVRTFWLRQGAAEENGRALGFDMPASQGSSAGQYFSPDSIGHLGFTGTSFWFDLEKDFLVVLLTNRVHPTRRNEKIKAFRPVIHDRIARTFWG